MEVWEVQYTGGGGVKEIEGFGNKSDQYNFSIKWSRRHWRLVAVQIVGYSERLDINTGGEYNCKGISSPSFDFIYDVD